MQHLQPNTFLQGGKYKIVRFISAGGFGCTYEAELCMIHKRVAIKEFFVKNFCNRDSDTSYISVATSNNKELVDKLKQKFVDEAASIWQFNHPNIVRVTDVFEENGTAYYVMDFVDGLSLHAMLKRDGALAESRAIRYVRQVAGALDYVHSKNRLHLDIKPGNIMVDQNDNAILIDFGASKQYDEHGENTSTLLGLNTVGYAPVEQMSRSFSNFNPSADVYALGATLYKLLTNITPPDAVLLMAGDEELIPLPKGISFATSNAVAHAMIPQRKKRTQTVRDFLDELSDSLPNESHLTTQSVETALKETPREEENTIIIDTCSPEVQNASIDFDIDGVTFKMLRVEGGTFDMKETVSSGFLGLSTKEIIQKTTLSDYYIGKTEVTQALWKAVMGNNPSTFKGDNLPVESVSWNDCQKFISKLNSMTGLDFRLPTEAEWEFAARGGNRSNHYQYSGSDNLDDVAWYGSNSGGETHAVATKNPNELGLYDMSGNVWEWCSDWYGGYSSSSQSNPKGPSSGSSRVNRGGSWVSNARLCRSSLRGSDAPGRSGDYLGLRLVLVP